MGFLQGKRALIVGLASTRSIAWGIARAMQREGAELAFTYQNEKLKERVEDMAAQCGSEITMACDVASDEQIEAALALKRGVIFLTPHLGCFEVTAQAYAQRYGIRGLKGQQGHPMTVLFRPPRKAWLHELVTSARARPGLHTAPTTLAGVKQMIKALRKGDCVGLLPDQVPPQGQGVWATFFGRDAYTMTLAVRLAQQTNASVLIAWGERLTWARGFKVHVQPLSAGLPADVNQAVAAINRAMENLIRQCPQQYLWGYARYKTPRDDV